MKQNKIRRAAASLALLLVMFFPSAGVFAASATANTTITGTIGAMISISATGTTVPVAFSVTPTGVTPLMSSQSDTVSIITNSVTGYTLGIKDADANFNMVAAGGTISPTAGTAASPLAIGLNQWGYRVDNGVGFGAGGPTTALNSQTAVGTWAGITGTSVTIYSSNVKANPATIKVWYGMNINSIQPTGTYVDTVIYTATTTP